MLLCCFHLLQTLLQSCTFLLHLQLLTLPLFLLSDCCQLCLLLFSLTLLLLPMFDSLLLQLPCLLLTLVMKGPQHLRSDATQINHTKSREYMGHIVLSRHNGGPRQPRLERTYLAAMIAGPCCNTHKLPPSQGVLTVLLSSWRAAASARRASFAASLSARQLTRATRLHMEHTLQVMHHIECFRCTGVSLYSQQSSLEFVALPLQGMFLPPHVQFNKVRMPAAVTQDCLPGVHRQCISSCWYCSTVVTPAADKSASAHYLPTCGTGFYYTRKRLASGTVALSASKMLALYLLLRRMLRKVLWSSGCQPPVSPCLVRY